MIANAYKTFQELYYNTLLNDEEFKEEYSQQYRHIMATKRTGDIIGRLDKYSSFKPIKNDKILKLVCNQLGITTYYLAIQRYLHYGNYKCNYACARGWCPILQEREIMVAPTYYVPEVIV